jgi:hypothetical protein
MLQNTESDQQVEECCAGAYRQQDEQGHHLDLHATFPLEDSKYSKYSVWRKRWPVDTAR